MEQHLEIDTVFPFKADLVVRNEFRSVNQGKLKQKNSLNDIENVEL